MSKKNVLSCCDIIAWSSKYVLKMDKMRMCTCKWTWIFSGNFL